MPAHHRRRYYVHHDLEELQGLQRGGGGLLVQAKPIPRAYRPRQALPKLPPLYHYPKPTQSTSDSASFASTDWMTRSEPSSEKNCSGGDPATRRRSKPASTTRSLPALSSSSTTNTSSRRVPFHKEALKVNFVSASDLQDLLGGVNNGNHRGRRSSRVLPPLGDPETLESLPFSSYAWSHRPLVKSHQRLAQLGPVQQGFSDQHVSNGPMASFPSPRRSNGFSLQEARLEGKNSSKLDYQNLSKSSGAVPNYITEEPPDDLSDDDLDSASVLGGIGAAEEDMLFRRERVKKNLIRSAQETLKKYDGRRADPLSSLPSIKLGRRRGPADDVVVADTPVVSRLPLDSIPEGENEPREEQLSDDGASSWSSGSGGSRRRLLNPTAPWRPKSPALAKPGLAMIPENNVVVVSNTSNIISCANLNPVGAKPDHERTQDTATEGLKGHASVAKHQRLGYKGIRPKETRVSPPVQCKSDYDSFQKQDKPKSNTRIQQFREELTSKQKPRRIRFLNT